MMADMGVPTLFEQCAREMSYVPRGGTGVAVQAIVGREQSYEMDEATIRTTREVTIKTDVVTEPRSDATVEIDGEVWSVETVAKAPGGLVVMNVVRNRAITRRQRQ